MTGISAHANSVMRLEQFCQGFQSLTQDKCLLFPLKGDCAAVCVPYTATVLQWREVDGNFMKANFHFSNKLFFNRLCNMHFINKRI